MSLWFFFFNFFFDSFIEISFTYLEHIGQWFSAYSELSNQHHNTVRTFSLPQEETTPLSCDPPPSFPFPHLSPHPAPQQPLIYFLSLICLYFGHFIQMESHIMPVGLHLNKGQILEIQFINCQRKFYKLYFKLEAKIFEFSGAIQRNSRENTVQRFLWEVVICGVQARQSINLAYGKQGLEHSVGHTPMSEQTALCSAGLTYVFHLQRRKSFISSCKEGTYSHFPWKCFHLSRALK